MIGKVLDNRYELNEFIGKGGMSVVYRAQDKRTGHQVAVKILRPEYNRDEEFLGRFEREATTASKMSHHNIVNLLDVGQEGEMRYLVMEYVRGKTLKDMVHEMGALPPQVACQIAIRILSALQHAHQNGIIHRDIKPQNGLVHSEGHIKVADFGIARGAGSSTLTKTDSVMGSVYYFSPEQAKGNPVTAASDLYSVGVVMYEMLTGQVPFDGETPVAVAMQQINAQPKPMSSLKSGISPALEKVVLRAMEKNPENRYQSALEMAQDVHRAMHEPDGDWLSSIQDKPISQISQDTGRVKKKRALPQLIWLRIMGAAICLLALTGLAVGSVYIYNQVVNVINVPYLMDETEEEAIRLLIRSGLKVHVSRASDGVKPAGTVIMQTPEYDTRLKKGETVLLTISTGPEEKTVPNVKGKSLAEARAELEKLGITAVELPDRVLSNTPWNTVMDQSPAGGEVIKGGIVQLTLSGSSVILPGLEGKTREAAILELSELGIQVTEIKEVIHEDANIHNIVTAQGYYDAKGNPISVGNAAMKDTTAILVVSVLQPTQTDSSSGGEN